VFSHIHSATVPVTDQDAALDFYVNTLGWEKAMDQPIPGGGRWLTVVPPGATTQLVLADATWYGAERLANKETGITLVAPDIDGTYATLTARGVRFKQPVEVMPWGDKATWFSDLDGNEFFLVEAL
jgi:catechol 2,3-dioxygenase-like lactoylglutathione lyase family enzyme